MISSSAGLSNTDGLPAERSPYPYRSFFGGVSAVRQGLESQMAENELRLALGEAPRRFMYLVGRIGDRDVYMHDELGKLVINAEEGKEEIDPIELGMAQEVRDNRRASGTEDHPSTEAVPFHDAETPGLAKRRGKKWERGWLCRRKESGSYPSRN